MRSYKILWLVLLIAIPFAIRAAEAADETTNFARGASLYSANCGRCHNARGPAEYSDGIWPMIVTHMRVIAGLPGDQAREIEAFLRASNNPPVRVAIRKVPSAELSGEQLLQQYGCRGCHQIGGSGGTIGPSLDGVFARRGEAWVRTQIQRPKENNPKTIMPEFGLSDAEVSGIISVLMERK